MGENESQAKIKLFTILLSSRLLLSASQSFQGSMSVEEHIREFEKLLIKCAIQEPEEQTIVRYLGGLNPKYVNIVELQQFSTFDEVSVLAHKVEQQRRRNPFGLEYPKSFQHECKGRDFDPVQELGSGNYICVSCLF